MSEIQNFAPGDQVVYTRNATQKYENVFRGTVLEVLGKSVKVLLRNSSGNETVKCLKAETLTKVED